MPSGPAWPPLTVVTRTWLRDRAELLGVDKVGPLDRALLLQERLTFGHRRVSITTVSRPCAQAIADEYRIPLHDIVVSSPAIDSADFRPLTEADRHAARHALALPTSAFVIGVVANHAFANKRVDQLIAVAGRLGAILLVAGEFDVRASEYRELASSLGADVRYLGACHDMRRFYAGLDVFAQPSIYESYGMAAHEAMAVGVPTVISNGCGIAAELVGGDEAVVVDRRVPDELFFAIERLRDRAGHPDMVERGIAWAHRRSWADVADDLLPVLAGAAERHR